MQTIAVSVGENCIDRYLEPIGRDFSGGNAVNVAVFMQRAGCPTAYIGAIGDDQAGQTLLADIRREGVDVKYVKVYPGYPTAMTIVRLDDANERCFVHEDYGPKEVFELDEADITFILKHRLVHNTWQGGTEKYLPRFKQAGSTLVVQDYGERYSADFIDQTIAYVDIAFFSQPEKQGHNMQELAQQMFARGPRLVVVTQGSAGSLAYDGDLYFQAAFPVQVVDTLGAGDTYIGTFLANWLNNKGIPASMKAAAKTASETCTHYGGW